MSDNRFGTGPQAPPDPQQRQYPGGPPPRRNVTDDHFRARSGVDFQMPSTVNLDELRKTLNSQGVNGVPNILQMDLALRQVGLCIWCDITPIGEKPLDPNGRNQYREAELLKLKNENSTLRSRATKAEDQLAIVTQELNALKRETVKESE